MDDIAMQSEEMDGGEVLDAVSNEVENPPLPNTDDGSHSGGGNFCLK